MRIDPEDLKLENILPLLVFVLLFIGWIIYAVQNVPK